MAIFICILKNQLGMGAGIRKDRKGLVIGLKTSMPIRVYKEGIMAENTATPDKGERKELLSETFFELDALESLLCDYDSHDMDIDGPARGILLLLVRAAIKKIEYFEDKYNFKVPESETSHVEDLIKFFQTRALSARGGEVHHDS